MSRFKVVFENTIQSGGFSLEQYLITLHQEKDMLDSFDGHPEYESDMKLFEGEIEKVNKLLEG
ncbi:hypothetical protein AB7942_30245 [Neobacillus sp. BF23-41]|jgi:hypothetical protein|uniref:hypothetical protein n=1 Tax=Neobacillus sp. BF23-41 TaxID=3240280 RepID=UPI0034E473B8